MTSGLFDLTHVAFEGTAPAPRHVSPCPACAQARSRPLPKFVVDLDSPTDGFAAWVLEQSGLPPQDYRQSALNRRIPACLRALRVSSIEAARDLLERRPSLLPLALSSLLIGVTSFFRDPAVFEALEHGAVPQLARAAGPIRVWSAGCSTGEELYSVAILLAEAGLLHRSELFGTDCRADAVRRADAGCYSDDDLDVVPPGWRERYFEQGPTGGQAAEVLRARTRWAVHALGSRVPLGPWDLILWRNGGIYMTRSAGLAIGAGVVEALRPGGFLVLGRAERPPGGDALAPFARCIYRKGIQTT
jgi:chemotaxis protein methyltransferase CheR